MQIIKKVRIKNKMLMKRDKSEIKMIKIKKT